MLRPGRDGGPIRIVYIIDKLHLGGAQTHLAGLVASLDRDRFEPHVFCLERAGEAAERLVRQGVAIEALGTSRVYGPTAARAFVRLWRRLRGIAPEIVHTYLSSANIFGAFAAKLARVPCLITSRRDTGFGDGRIVRRAQSSTNRWAARVVAVSQDVARAVSANEGIGPPLMTVIPNGIDANRFVAQGRRAAVRRDLGVGASTPLVISVGHLSWVKATDVMVEAAALMRATLGDAVFLKVGEGPERDAVQTRISTLGLEGCFRLLGARVDVPELLEAADLFVLSSRSEGQPNAALEAMAMGLPVVASRVGGVPETIADGQEGLLVPPDDAGALARACLEILQQPALARRLGDNGRSRVLRDFTLSTMVRRYQDLYLEVLAELSPR